MALVARSVPGHVLAAALGEADPEQVAGLLAPVAAVYQPGTADPATADASVARLAALLSPPALPGPAGAPGGAGESGGADPSDERVAARIGLLIQACDATAGLIGNAVAAALWVPGGRTAVREPAGPPAEGLVQALVERTLRSDPPVLVTRRTAPDGATVTLDLTSGGPGGLLEFGWGRHACPGAEHVRGLAEGVIEPLLTRCRLAAAEISYPPPPALHVPERLVLQSR
jgi:hypothetical protein